MTLTAIPGVVFTYAILYCHQTNKPSMCSIAHKVDVVPIRKLCHVPRGGSCCRNPPWRVQASALVKTYDVSTIIHVGKCGKGGEIDAKKRKISCLDR